MPTYDLTLARAQAYSVVFDFRTAIVKAARQIMANYGITAQGPGDGITKVPRYFTSVDFQRGAATKRKSPVILGDRRYYEYSEFMGTFSVMITVPYETEQKNGTQYLTEDHARELDRVTSLVDAIFMEHVGQFTAVVLPLHEVTEMVPIDPDERPVEDREINVSYRRWQMKVNVRPDAWPAT